MSNKSFHFNKIATMKPVYSFLLLFVCLFSTPQLFAQTLNWETYQDEDAGFAIAFPTEPEHEIKTEKEDYLGDVTESEWSATEENDKVGTIHYNLTCKIASAETVFSAPDVAPDIIDGMLASFKKNENLTLIDNEKAAYGNYPGASYSLYYKDLKVYGIFRVYLIENKMLIMSVLAEKKPSKSATRFFDSFEISDATATPTENTCEERYTIAFPSEPESEMQMIDSEIGKLQMCLKTLNSSDDKIAYLSIYTQYPFSYTSLSEKDRENAYQKGIERVGKQLNGTVTMQRDCVIEKTPAKEFIVDTDDKSLFLKYRMVLIQNSMYMYGVVVGDKKDLNSKKVSTFMLSFKLLDELKNRKVEKPTCQNTYTLAFPGTPKDMQMDVATAAGKLNLCMKIFEVSDATAYAGYYTDYPESYSQLTQEEKETVYISSLKGLVSQVKGEIVSQTDCTMDVYKGKELIAKAQEGKMWIKYQIVLVGSRMYMCGQFAEAKTDFDKKESTTFFNSFKVLQNQK